MTSRRLPELLVAALSAALVVGGAVALVQDRDEPAPPPAPGGTEVAIAGFQFGASYVPNATQDTAAPTPASIGYTRGFAVGANFVRTLGPVDVRASATYFGWQGPPTGVTTNAPDPDVYQFGLVVGFAGFAIGASYAEVDGGRSAAGAGPLRQEGRGRDPLLIHGCDRA